jgi:hypothetical protein
MTMKFSVLFQGMGHLTPGAAALMLLASGSMLMIPTEAEARAYKCFDRQSGELVAVSDIDITTPSVSCLPSDEDDDDDDVTETTPDHTTDHGDHDEDEPSTPSTTTPSTPAPSTSTIDPLAARRAINLARGTAVSLNGGLSQYRPGACMFASTKNNPCITRADSEGIEFTIPGGPPGWEQNGDQPSTITVVVISADGRSVLNSRNN